MKRRSRSLSLARSFILFISRISGWCYTLPKSSKCHSNISCDVVYVQCISANTLHDVCVSGYVRSYEHIIILKTKLNVNELSHKCKHTQHTYYIFSLFSKQYTKSRSIILSALLFFISLFKFKFKCGVFFCMNAICRQYAHQIVHPEIFNLIQWI